MTLSDHLKKSIKEQQLTNKPNKIFKTTDEKILTIVRSAQFNIWKLLIEEKIHMGETKICFNLRKINNQYVYLSNYDYQTNLNLLLTTPQGQNFVKWLTNHGLTFDIFHQYDGAGIESWDTISIKAI